MIEGLKGAAVLKELTTIAQNLEKKLGLPVSVEALQKLLETKDGYKYLANIDGKLTEILSKKELETGVKYWADGVKNQLSNTLTLENLVQKPHILQSEIFKSDTLSKALGFEKLVEVVKAEMAKIVAAPQKSADAAPVATQQTAAQPEANKNTPNAIRLVAAEAELSKPLPQTTQTTQAAQTPTDSAKTTETRQATAQKETPKAEPQKSQTQEAAAKSEVAVAKETVLKELKAAVNAPAPTTAATAQAAKEEPRAAKSGAQESTQKSEAPKEAQKEASTQRAFEKLSGETLRDKLREFKNIMASHPSVPSKAEMERAKTEQQVSPKEPKVAMQERLQESTRAENIEKLIAVLSQNFEMLPQSTLEDAAKKIADLLFGKLPDGEADEAVLKALEHLEKQMNEREAKGAAGKKPAHANDVKIAEDEGAAAKVDSEQTPAENQASKTDNPASKLKAQLLEEMAKVATKSDFQILSQVAMSLNKEVFTVVLEDKGVLQFKKKGNKELNAKTVEFYSAFETLGPVSGEITHIDGSTSLALNVEFESTYNFLKETLKDLSFFDHKNVSITHGIKEIVEIRSSFLDTTG